jgi:hypothetical protein
VKVEDESSISPILLIDALYIKINSSSWKKIQYAGYYIYEKKPLYSEIPDIVYTG